MHAGTYGARTTARVTTARARRQLRRAHNGARDAGARNDARDDGARDDGAGDDGAGDDGDVGAMACATMARATMVRAHRHAVRPTSDGCGDATESPATVPGRTCAPAVDSASGGQAPPPVAAARCVEMNRKLNILKSTSLVSEAYAHATAVPAIAAVTPRTDFV